MTNNHCCDLLGAKQLQHISTSRHVVQIQQKYTQAKNN